MARRVEWAGITFADFAARWLEQVGGLRPTSKAWYEGALRLHANPKIGRLKMSELTVDDIAGLIDHLQREGLAPTTIRSVLVPVNRVIEHGIRRGALSTNPVHGLERHERPKVQREEMRFLNAGEIDALLTHAADRYRTLLATAIFTGLRSGELLGLPWSDVDFDEGLVHVRQQVHRSGLSAPLKTRNAQRAVLLMPALGRMLSEHRAGSSYSQASDYVFTRPDGRPMHPDSVRRLGLHPAVKRAGIDTAGKPRLRFHDLRHTFASLLIAQGVNVAFASRQLGHASVSTTLNVYTHLFDHAEHAATVLERLEGRFGETLRATETEPAVV